jgi:cell division protein FtsL
MAAVAAPTRPRPRTDTQPQRTTRIRARRRPRSHAAIAWIVVSAVLLAGIVFVNLAVLRLNLAVDNASQERTKLRASNAQLQSELSSALASPRIQAQARREDGLTPADPSTIGYVNVAP